MAFLDSDDFWEERRLEKLIKILKENGQYMVADDSLCFFGDDAAKIMVKSYHEESRQSVSDTPKIVEQKEMTSPDTPLESGHLQLGCHYTKIMKDIGKKTVTRM